MIKPITVDETIYDKQFVANLRNDVINVRNEALKLGDFKTAVLLSHVIVALQHYNENLDR